MSGFDGVVEGFAGPGGWSTGLRIAGYTGRAIGIEQDLATCRTAVAAGHERICADVADYPVERFTGADGAIFSPPCRSFSPAGNRQGLADPRGRLTLQPLRWARILRPRWLACEQVPEVLPIWRHIAHELRPLGYSTWVGTLQAADFGVPQTRLRSILLARRDGIPATPPDPTHSRTGGEGLFGTLPRWVSMAHALGWPPHLAVRSNYGTGGDPTNRGIRRADQPAATVTSKVRRNLVHPTPAGTSTARGGGRPITLSEASILQGFPADYPWQGTCSQQDQQVGDAVPPPVAAAILRPLLTLTERRTAA